MSSLSEITVLAIDCQATHNNPSIGHLAEIGWVKTQAIHPFDHEMTIENAKSHLVKMEKQSQMPNQFSRITGINSEEMKEAISKKIIWQKLDRAAKKTASDNHGICPTVIHFSRYESPYLEQLH
ncbi:MAG: exonuclease domain-containing protein, partial [Candidatus Aminicenantaceae bacterium]